MGWVSPEKLFDEIEPYNVDTYCSFVKEHVVPLYVLAKEYVKSFEGDTSAIAVGCIIEASEKLLNLVKEKGLCNVDISYNIPSDPLEVGRELLEYAANIFLGVGDAGKLTFFVYSLRHLPAEYIHVLYPQLEKEERVRTEVFSLLGITTKFRPPIEGALTEKLQILGYIDYPMMCSIESEGGRQRFRIAPVKQVTLGGTISRLIDAVASVLKRPGLLNAYELNIDVLKECVENCLSIVTIPSRYGVYANQSFSQNM